MWKTPRDRTARAAAASEALTRLLNETLLPIRKVYGMYGRIQIAVEDVTPRDLTVRARTKTDVRPDELARDVRNAVLNYLGDALPCERFRFLLYYPDRNVVRREYLLPYLASARFAGILPSRAILVEQHAAAARREFRPRIRAAWDELVAAWSEQRGGEVSRSEEADRPSA